MYVKHSQSLSGHDLYARKCELETLRDAVESAQEDLTDYEGDDAEERETLQDAIDSAQDDYGEEEQAELKTLEELETEIHGSLRDCYLIHDDDFEDYARQTAEDIGALENCDHWPATCIDWEKAADELRQDYTCIEYQGETYYTRE